jgi:clan AA aspartic protease
MGITKVDLEIKNPENQKLKVKTRFLVDSGASFTVLPRELVKKLNLKPSFQQSFTLADGRVVKRKIGNALIKFRKREVASPVVLGKKEDTLLLGVLTLEAMGLILDPFQRRLYRAKLML